eukprot:283575_1
MADTFEADPPAYEKMEDDAPDVEDVEVKVEPDKEDPKPEEEDLEEEKKKDTIDSNANHIDPNFVPKDYNPKPRGSIAETATIPKYKGGARRLSKLEMEEMKQANDELMNALIQDPQEAARRYTVDQEEQKQHGLKDRTGKAKQPSDFHTKPDLEPFTPCTLLAGCAPVIFLLILVIFGLIVYSIANKPGNDTYEAGPWGDWPNWGGNLDNQQTAAGGSLLNSSNIDDLQMICDYTQVYDDADAIGGASGFIATDKRSKNGYFVDESGYATSIDLEDCSLNWRVQIQSALNIDIDPDVSLVSRNGVALYRDIDGNRGMLIGTPSVTGGMSSNCYVLALNQRNGNKIFSIELEANGAPYCVMDGFIVESHYAYGGIKTSSTCNDDMEDVTCTYRGEMIKIDLNRHSVAERWYTLPEVTNLNEYYYGAAPQNYPSIIGDYLVFGTGSLFGNPEDIDFCLSGDLSSIKDAIPTNVCGVDRANASAAWRCFEADVYNNAVNVLNKTTFEHIGSVPLSGNDKSTATCNLYDDTHNEALCGNVAAIGPGGDVAAQATYTREGIEHAAVLTKSGMFFVFALPSLEVSLATKVGPSGINGGGLFSLAVDTVHNIAILSITGSVTAYEYTMADGTHVCGTGFVQAIDLETGDTLWQLVNPFGVIGDACVEDAAEYDATDWALERDDEPCKVGLPQITDVITQVVIPDIEGVRVPLDANERATFIAPLTIANDLVFIPSNTGDVFVSDITTGSVLRTLRCENKASSWWEEGLSGYNRAGISAGVTVVQDIAIMYCGSGVDGLQSTIGNEVKLYRLA